MKALITPCSLQGNTVIPSSKSYTHRILIAAFLSNKEVIIKNPLLCDDTIATINIIKGLGGNIKINDGSIVSYPRSNDIVNEIFECNASGSTARFFIPIISYFKNKFTISGISKLMDRLNTSDLDDLKGLEFTFNKSLTIEGRLNEKVYHLSTKHTTQFISGMIFIMPFYSFKIVIDGELSPYIMMTIDAMEKMGFKYRISNKTIEFLTLDKNDDVIEYEVEADYSNASYFLNMQYLGNDISITNLKRNSLQGDKKYLDFLKLLFSDEKIINIDLDKTPDLGPALFAVASVSNKEVHITGIEKLFIKESNRVEAMIKNLSLLGANLICRGNEVIIYGKKSLSLSASCDSYNDHRIVMSLVSIASKCEKPFTILNCEAVSKSYPSFFEDYIKLNGKVVLGE